MKKGSHQSEESRKKMSFAHKGKILTEEHKKNIGKSGKGHHGYKVTEETLKKMKESHIGKKNSKETIEKMKGRIPWNKGKSNYLSKESRNKMGEGGRKQKGTKKPPLSEEQKRRLSEINSGKTMPQETKLKISKSLSNMKKSIQHRINLGKNRMGCLSPKWQGGKSKESVIIRHSVNFRLWRESVFKRDNWTCQNCGNRGDILHPHHLKSFSSFPELRFAIDNGITLCVKCHQLEHKTLKLSDYTKMINHQVGHRSRDIVKMILEG